MLFRVTENLSIGSGIPRDDLSAEEVGELLEYVQLWAQAIEESKLREELKPMFPSQTLEDCM